jgi:hypothetical protein
MALRACPHGAHRWNALYNDARGYEQRTCSSRRVQSTMLSSVYVGAIMEDIVGTLCIMCGDRRSDASRAILGPLDGTR